MRAHGTIVQHRIPRHGPFLQALFQIGHEKLVKVRILVQKGEGQFRREPPRENFVRVPEMAHAGLRAGLRLHLHALLVRGAGRGGGVAAVVDLHGVSRGRRSLDDGRAGGGVALLREAGRHAGRERLITGVDNVEAQLEAEQRRVLLVFGAVLRTRVDEPHDDLADGIGVPQQLMTQHQRARRIPPRARARPLVVLEHPVQTPRHELQRPRTKDLAGNQIVRRPQRVFERFHHRIGIVAAGSELFQNFFHLVRLAGLEGHAERVSVGTVGVTPLEHEMHDILQFGHVQLFFFLLVLGILRLLLFAVLLAVKFLLFSGDILANGGIDEPFDVRPIPLGRRQDTEVFLPALQRQPQRLSGFLQVKEDTGRERRGRAFGGVVVDVSSHGGVGVVHGIVVVLQGERAALGDGFEIGKGLGHLVPQGVHDAQ
mmetsp:Transcript_18928/g.39876  ORF Transcript_18928/g.39876 Transcript_18928/m.39876 type:complete len:427 (+) Transcript_18928:2130-3410(+)